MFNLLKMLNVDAFVIIIPIVIVVFIIISIIIPIIINLVDIKKEKSMFSKFIEHSKRCSKYNNHICSYCGSKNNEKDKTCSHCGAPLNNIDLEKEQMKFQEDIMKDFFEKF